MAPRSHRLLRCAVLAAALIAAWTGFSNVNRDRAAIGLGEAGSAAFRAVFPESEYSEPPHLIGFYAEQSMEAKRMRYLGGLLEKELPGTRIVWLEAWENPLNERLRASIDLRNQCNGVPYLFNRKTGKVICGVQAYDKLRLWAQGLGGDPRIYRESSV
eukprot:TRINITY_DN3867_c4_g1_i1.p1 TRINITY_DN3867_c4_g1~~TRINITY_DN3867_c4_g1_i1.p1  ORF type:complete len:158 (+),score=24.85 TRINITY_DN3867_c4_g1_i1:59-532(+)